MSGNPTERSPNTAAQNLQPDTRSAKQFTELFFRTANPILNCYGFIRYQCCNYFLSICATPGYRLGASPPSAPLPAAPAGSTAAARAAAPPEHPPSARWCVCSAALRRGSQAAGLGGIRPRPPAALPACAAGRIPGRGCSSSLATSAAIVLSQRGFRGGYGSRWCCDGLSWKMAEL